MSKAPSRALRFTRLRLINWRNFRTVDVELGARAFIVGPNASGKSNLLDAIRFISEIARLGTGGLSAAVEDRGGFSAIRCLHARNPAYVEIEATVGTDEEPCAWTYTLRFDRKGRRKERRPAVSLEQVRKGASLTVVAIQTRSDESDSVAFAQTILEQAKQSEPFRELQSFLSSCRYLHVVPQVVRDRRRALSAGDDPYGGDLLRRMNDMPRKTRDPRLRRIGAALAVAVPQFSDLQLRIDNDGTPHLHASYTHWRASASSQSERYFSDGTLRLIGLLWAISERGGPLLLEEPELSLNEAIVRQLPRMLRLMQRLSRRQALLTTHSPALLDGDNVGLNEVLLIEVGGDGSKVLRLSSDRQIVAQVEGNSTISEAVLPRLAPQGSERLGLMQIAS